MAAAAQEMLACTVDYRDGQCTVRVPGATRGPTTVTVTMNTHGPTEYGSVMQFLLEDEWEPDSWICGGEAPNEEETQLAVLFSLQIEGGAHRLVCQCYPDAHEIYWRGKPEEGELWTAVMPGGLDVMTSMCLDMYGELADGHGRGGGWSSDDGVHMSWDYVRMQRKYPHVKGPTNYTLHLFMEDRDDIDPTEVMFMAQWRPPQHEVQRHTEQEAWTAAVAWGRDMDAGDAFLEASLQWAMQPTAACFGASWRAPGTEVFDGTLDAALEALQQSPTLDASARGMQMFVNACAEGHLPCVQWCLAHPRRLHVSPPLLEVGLHFVALHVHAARAGECHGDYPGVTRALLGFQIEGWMADDTWLEALHCTDYVAYSSGCTLEWTPEFVTCILEAAHAAGHAVSEDVACEMLARASMPVLRIYLTGPWARQFTPHLLGGIRTALRYIQYISCQAVYRDTLCALLFAAEAEGADVDQFVGLLGHRSDDCMPPAVARAWRRAARRAAQRLPACARQPPAAEEGSKLPSVLQAAAAGEWDARRRLVLTRVARRTTYTYAQRAARLAAHHA